MLVCNGGGISFLIPETMTPRRSRGADSSMITVESATDWLDPKSLKSALSQSWVSLPPALLKEKMTRAILPSTAVERSAEFPERL